MIYIKCLIKFCLHFFFFLYTLTIKCLLKFGLGNEYMYICIVYPIPPQ